MLSLTESYTKDFEEKNKTKSLYWHPIVGFVRVWMKFLISGW
jgi:hypothetical protein